MTATITKRWENIGDGIFWASAYGKNKKYLKRYTLHDDGSITVRFPHETREDSKSWGRLRKNAILDLASLVERLERAGLVVHRMGIYL